MAARLRKTFRYATDAAEPNSDSEPEVLDEQDQETLIDTLHQREASTNDFYRKAFTPLPLVAALAYLPTVVMHPSVRLTFLALLSLTALATSAWVLWYIEPRAPDIKGKRAVQRGDGRGPVDKYLPWLNAALTGLLLLVALLSWRRGLLEETWRAVLPAVISLIVMFARAQMTPLNIAELERLRYSYKGA